MTDAYLYDAIRLPRGRVRGEHALVTIPAAMGLGSAMVLQRLN